MAANTSKDQPPAYTSQDNQASTTGDYAIPPRAPAFISNHSTRAWMLFHDSTQGRCTTLQHLELTFSVMIFCHGVCQPVVLAIDEDHDILLNDLHHIFMKAMMTRNANIRVFWGNGWGEVGRDLKVYGSVVNSNNITAMFRLLKSMNGAGYLYVS